MTMDERIIIEKYLNQGNPFRSIAINAFNVATRFSEVLYWKKLMIS